MTGVPGVATRNAHHSPGTPATNAPHGLERRASMPRHDRYGWSSKLVQVPEEQAAIQRVLELRQEGMTLQKIADAMVAEERPGNWGPVLVHRIITQADRDAQDSAQRTRRPQRRPDAIDGTQAV